MGPMHKRAPWLAATTVAVALACVAVASPSHADQRPTPLLAAGRPVSWWFVFKFNASTFKTDDADPDRACPFGGEAVHYSTSFGQRYAVASSRIHGLRLRDGLIGTSAADPVGATFGEVYNGHLNYVVWNDQFYGDPAIAGCSSNCASPWGHSKGLLAWNDAGEGFVLQVTTPSWPAAGSREHERASDGNTLGCVEDNDVKVSQHFFALRLSKPDVLATLKALANASVVTDPANPQIVRNGGPANFQAIVSQLGKKSTNTTATRVLLSSGVTLISKPSKLHVPPWQMVSALLDVPLRTATWWASPRIPSTNVQDVVGCWDASLGAPRAVEIATTGRFQDKTIGLKGGPGPDFNHAKIGVSLSLLHRYSVFGDLNQQGSLTADCDSSQNGRGGLFFVVDDAALSNSVGDLLSGETAPGTP